MRPLIQKLADPTGHAFGTLLVIGAGQGADLAPLRRLEAKRLVMVEANPRLAEMLVQRLDPGRGEQVLTLAATPDACPEAALHIVNQAQHSSLLPPEGLLRYFQNLHVTQQVGVRAQSLADLVDGLDLAPDERHVLVLDAPGTAQELLLSLPHALLQRFESVVVRAGAEPLYAGESPLDDALATVRGRGFDAVAEDPEAIFPHRAVLLARNDARCRELVLEQRAQAQAGQLEEQRELIQRLTQERDAQAAELTGLKASLEAAAAAREAQLKLEADQAATARTLMREHEDAARRQAGLAAERLAQLEAATQARESAEKQAADLGALLAASTSELDSLTKLASARHAQIQTATRERDALAGQLAELTAQLEARAQTLEEQARRCAELQAQVQKLTVDQGVAIRRIEELSTALEAKTAECNEQSKLAAARHAQIQSATRERDATASQAAEIKAQLDARVAELAETRHVVALSVRLQTLREADLKDLQGRYEAVYRRSEEQHQLLSKLAERLRVASGYFHQLSALQQSAEPDPLLVAVAPRGRKAKAGPAPAPRARKPAVPAPARKKAAAAKAAGKGVGKPGIARSRSKRQGD